MAQITVKNITEKKVWEEFVLSENEANFLQSWSWGDFHKALGKQIFRIGFFEKEKLIGVMLSVIEPARRGKYLTVPGGPIIDWQNKNIADTFANQIKQIAKENNCVFIRVRPQLKSDDSSRNLFKNLGFIRAPMHLHAELTSQLDITKSEEELMAQMRKATRYEIRKGIKEKIKITSSKDEKEIKKFYDLQIETAKRQKFVPFSYEFLYEQFKVFAQNGNALLYKAELEKELLAQAFVIFYGKEAVYHYGASTDEGRRFPGAYLIQWEAIKEAKKRGMTRYNLWGVSPESNTNHRFSGLSLFKRGFGGIDFEYLHAQDLIINKPKYLINYAIESLRNRLRGL
ncbi:MAG: peptidoglycan bridge formation glycyltransferase FemA/FemB family protein [Candidatus Levybacteria bacterium]|nr:peptidoglycan bridge formation glycyltransferase FemA/FemB family protein [Candidatus Levybacteria bacterium]MDZ4228206.1 peptidoglycan bridge formation glycyltransferase FemA/FemB family protein [Candidatus Levybacteria bacterium]